MKVIDDSVSQNALAFTMNEYYFLSLLAGISRQCFSELLQLIVQNINRLHARS